MVTRATLFAVLRGFAEGREYYGVHWSDYSCSLTGLRVPEPQRTVFLRVFVACSSQCLEPVRSVCFNSDAYDDTLVLDSISFVDSTWLARGGFFHSDKMRVIEKLTRQGSEILYEVTVEDPEVLVEPWVMTPKRLRLSPNTQIMAERNHCEVYELEDIATQIRH